MKWKSRSLKWSKNIRLYLCPLRRAWNVICCISSKLLLLNSRLKRQLFSQGCFRSCKKDCLIKSDQQNNSLKRKHCDSEEELHEYTIVSGKLKKRKYTNTNSWYMQGLWKSHSISLTWPDIWILIFIVAVVEQKILSPLFRNHAL